MKILKKLIWACPLAALVWNITKEWKETKGLEERARRDMAEIDAEEKEREAERRNIPKPERPEDVTVRECSGTFYTADEEIHIVSIGLYCKGKLVGEYPTRAEAEAARLQFIRDYNIKDKEENYQL